jgi:hypothetical protein
MESDVEIVDGFKAFWSQATDMVKHGGRYCLGFCIGSASAGILSFMVGHLLRVGVVGVVELWRTMWH